ncbi:MAG: DUF1648 domain-containing protein [Spirochaetales bacterium]|nr:DUF1648 domain-containing protein [Spirochaetales bacterium]
MKLRVLAVILLIVSVVLSIVCYLALPDVVTTQIDLNGNPTTMPKLLAILIPAVIGIGGSAVSIIEKGESRKSLVISLVGVALFCMMLVVNLI